MKNKEKKSQYVIRRAVQVPLGQGGWNDPAWADAQTLEIRYFFKHSSYHRPLTKARVMYDDQKLYVQFHVIDRYVRTVAEKYQDAVCNDSCVEFFVQPKPGGSYFNFEVSAGGCMLLYCIPCSSGVDGMLEGSQPVPFDLIKEMGIYHSLPSRIDPELEEPCEWSIEYAIPLALFEHYVGSVQPLFGQTWKGNFFKCADDTSHPHWGMWSPIPDGDRFHRPDCFGDLIFDR